MTCKISSEKRTRKNNPEQGTGTELLVTRRDTGHDPASRELTVAVGRQDSKSLKDQSPGYPWNQNWQRDIGLQK